MFRRLNSYSKQQALYRALKAFGQGNRCLGELAMSKLDRLARSTRNLLETMELIREAGGKFRSLSEPWADTTTHAGKMIMTIFAGIAEFERDLIGERTSAGREAAQKRGVRFGRPRKLTLDQSELARRLVLEGKAVSDIARTFNVHSATIYRLADPDSSDVQMAMHS